MTSFHTTATIADAEAFEQTDFELLVKEFADNGWMVDSKLTDRFSRTWTLDNVEGWDVKVWFDDVTEDGIEREDALVAAALFRRFGTAEAHIIDYTTDLIALIRWIEHKLPETEE
jgi:hypothetical protein